MYKIIGADQQEYGPVTDDDIRQWLAEGRANGQTPVQAEGSAEWKPLSSYPEFAAALAASPSAKVPPPFGTMNLPSPPTPEEVVARDYEVDIGSCLGRSWALVKENFFPIVGITFLILIINSIVNQIISLIYRPSLQEMVRSHEFSLPTILLIVLATLLIMPIQTLFMGGLYNYYLKLIRGEPANIGDAFSGFSLAFGQLALAGLLVGILSMVGALFCIIPGIYLSIAWIFSIPLVIDRRMNAWDAMELSRRVVTKHWFMVFALMIVIVLVSLCGLIACCIGVFVTGTIGWVALMYAYEDIFNRRAP